MVDPIKIQKGEVFLQEGDQGKEAFYLISGKMEVIKNINGKSVKLSELLEGAIFGEICLIDNQTRTTSVVTLESCSIQKITPNNIETIIKKDPDVGLAIIKTLTSRFRNIMDLLGSENLA
jgi:CRP/FNR family transcriptional regulator, cyclic AMP receptor protein